MECRRFIRLTKCIPQEAGEPKGVGRRAQAHCNFVRIHRTLRMTATMAAGASDRLWSVEELIQAVC